MARKRGQNEGTIFEEKPGRWVALLTLGYEVRDGKRRRIRKKFVAATRDQVSRKLIAALREHQTGGIVPIERDTLGVYLKSWLKSLPAKGRRLKTVESYTWVVNTHIIPELGHIPLTRFTQRDLNEFMLRKVEQRKAEIEQRKADAKAAGQMHNAKKDFDLVSTMRYCLRIIKSALSKAEKDGLVSRNVAKLAEPPAAPASKVNPLTPNEARNFLAAVRGHRLEALYSVAMAIGLSRSETMGLAKASLDLDRGQLSVTQTAQRIKGKGIVIEQDAKRRTRLRSIPLPAFAIAALRRHLEWQDEERRLADDAWREHGLVFTSTIGTPIEPTNLRRHMHGVLRMLNIDRRRFHDLRHTAASLLLAQGATLHEVKEILGHSQIALTANLYGHAYTSVLQATVDRVGSVLAPQNPVAPPVAPFADRPRPN